MRHALTLLLLPGTVFAQWADVSAIVEREMAENGVGALSLGIVKGPELVYEAAFGYADMERRVQATPGHVYRIGSITKQFTGLALLKLVQAGTVRLTDPVEKHFPEIERVRDRFADAPPITLVQLATMTSGLAREPEDLASFLVGPADEWLEIVGRSLTKVRYEHPPDTRYLYSNIGYAILGASLERASSRDFMDYVREEILDPLGMTNTDFVPRDHFERRIATGYVVGDGETDYVTPAAEHLGRGYKVPNGALYSTVPDLGRFVSFQLGHGPESILPRARLEENFSRLNSASGDLTTGYGIGFSVHRRGEQVVFGHGGSVAGYEAACIFDRETQTGVIILRNVTGDQRDVAALAERILGLLSAEDPS